MIFPYDFTKSGRYKTQLHSHTTTSDGSQTPTQVIDGYYAEGYAALALTDHNHATTNWPWPTNPGMTAIQGNEISHSWHVLSLFNDYEATTSGPAYSVIQGYIDDVEANGGLTVIAHPNYRSIPLSAADLLAVTGYLGIEIYNGLLTYDALATDKWDDLLSAGRQAWGFANDDFHSPARTYVRAENMVLADSASEANIKAALIAGNFYAVSGSNALTFSNISLSVLTLTVTVNTAATITFIGNGGTTLKTEAGVTTSTYPICGNEKYVRIEATVAGCTIYSNPLYLEEDVPLSALATWASVLDLPQITVTGLATGNAVRLYDSAGNIHASVVESGGTATLTYTLD